MFGEVDHQVVAEVGEAGEERLVVGERRVRGGVPVLADVDPEGDGEGAEAREAAPRRRHPLVVEAERIAQARRLRQAEEARPRIARLRPRRHRPHLQEAEAQGGQAAHGDRVLVEAGGQADRVGEAAAEERLGERRRGARRGQGEGAERAQDGDPGAVGGLGVEPEEQAGERLVGRHGRRIVPFRCRPGTCAIVAPPNRWPDLTCPWGGNRHRDRDAMPPTNTPVEIFGAVYNVRGTDDSGYLQGLADLVDRHMREVAQQVSTADTARIAILAALNIADELFRIQQRQEGERVEIREKMEALTAELSRALAG